MRRRKAERWSSSSCEACATTRPLHARSEPLDRETSFSARTHYQEQLGREQPWWRLGHLRRRRRLGGADPPADVVKDRKSFARLSTDLIVRWPFLWRLLRGPLRQMFDQLAPGWGLHRTPDYLAAFHTALAGLPRTPTRVLDLGSGTGEPTVALAQRWPSAEVIGVDVSPGMVGRGEAPAPSRPPWSSAVRGRRRGRAPVSGRALRPRHTRKYNPVLRRADPVS